VRIADTLLRSGHLSEDALAAVWYTGERPAHLDRCDICAERALAVSRWLEQVRDLGNESADAAFPQERLAAQQSHIMRRLEQADRPAKLLSFPTVAPQTVEAPVWDRRGSARWIAAAAAAGLVLGVIGGRLSVWQPAAPPPAVSAAVIDPPRQSERTEELFPLEEDVPQPQVQSLSAIDELTPQVTVVKASNTRRR
jgi:hypothetical protein